MNISNFKKWHFLVIAAVILALALSIGGFLRFKQFRQEERERLELARAQCMEEVRNMTDEQIVEKINALTIAREELRGIIGKMVSYLFCYIKSNRTEEAYNKTQALIQNLEITQAAKEQILRDFENFSEEIVFKENFLYLGMIHAFEPLESICSGDEEKDEYLKICSEANETKKDITPEEAKAIIDKCKQLCDVINKYSGDPPLYITEHLSKIPKEAYFSVLFSNGSELSLQRFAVAFRLGGKEFALKACDIVFSLESDSVKKCEDYINTLDTLDIIKKGCVEHRQTLINLVCLSGI